MKLFAIVQMQSGQPKIDQTVTPYSGYVLCDQVGGYGAYLISGTSAQLTAINALSQVVGICAVTEGGSVKWAELDSVVSTTVMNALNTWKNNNHPTWPTVTSSNTYRQIVNFLFNKFSVKFDLNLIDIIDG